MNEIIAKLTQQCYEYNETMQGTWFNKTKFAELIVAECADYCKGHILPKDVAEQNGLTYNDGVGDCYYLIRKHFGVEE